MPRKSNLTTCTVPGCGRPFYSLAMCKAHHAALRAGRFSIRLRRSMTSEERFWGWVNKDGPVVAHVGTACWLWTGSVRGDGYGCLRHEGRQWSAHRFSYMLANKDIPANTIIRHMCDIQTCVNPSHLMPGSHHDNTADKVSRGRQAKGEGNGFAKLSNESALAIFVAAHSGEPAAHLAARFGVSKGTVWMIKHGRYWKHVTADIRTGEHHAP